MIRRRWLQIEDLCIRLHYRKRPIAWLERRLGRTRSQIRARAHAMGLSVPQRFAELDMERIVRDRNAHGWSDSEIAAECRVCRHAVGALRKRLGLPCNATSQRMRDRVRRNTARQLAAAGVSSLAELKAVVVRRRNVRAGWPAELPPREADILEYLWSHGPSTRYDIYTGIGMRWKGSNSGLCNRPAYGKQTSYLADLRRRGLVVYLGRIISGRGQGRNIGLYSLPLTIRRQRYEEVDRDRADGGRGHGPAVGDGDAERGPETPH